MELNDSINNPKNQTHGGSEKRTTSRISMKSKQKPSVCLN